MIKKSICFLCTIVCILFCSCSTNIDNSSDVKSTDERQERAALIINGIKVECQYTLSINHTEGYAELPLILIINSLGGKVDWISEREVYIRVNNKDYVLNCVELSLYQDGVDFNILSLPPGSTHRVYYRVQDQEFIVDSDSIRFFLSLIDEEIDIDYNTLAVELLYKQHPYSSLFDSTDKK